MHLLKVIRMGHNEPLRLMFQTLSVTGIAQQLFGLGAAPNRQKLRTTRDRSCCH